MGVPGELEGKDSRDDGVVMLKKGVENVAVKTVPAACPGSV